MFLTITGKLARVVHVTFIGFIFRYNITSLTSSVILYLDFGLQIENPSFHNYQ